jgi:hypothetical protein
MGLINNDVICKTIRVASQRPVVSGSKKTRWRPDEEKSVRELLPSMSLAEIGHRIGRSAAAVNLYRKRRRLPAMTKSPGWLTANKARLALGLSDARIVIGWIKSGLLQGQRAQGLKTYVVREIDLKRWVIDPISWAYFDASKIKDPAIGRLVNLAMNQWNDEWLTTRQIADQAGTNTEIVVQAIKRNQLPAIHLMRKGGRAGEPAWAFWAIRASDAKRWIASRRAIDVYDQAHAFMFLASAIGLSHGRIAALMKWNRGTIANHLKLVRKPPVARAIVEKYDFQNVAIEGKTIYADWRDYRDKFPRIQRAFERYLNGTPTTDELGLVLGMLKYQASVKGMKCNPNAIGRVSLQSVSHFAEKMSCRGISPCIPHRRKKR